MNEIISLDATHSTTRRVVKTDPEVIAKLIKQSTKPEDQFETQVFLPAGENRQGEGGLRTKGYFKVGGLIQEESIAMSLRGALATRQSIDGEGVTTNEAINLEDSHTHYSEGGNLSSPLTESTSPETNPLITVVTVVYNGEQFLEETILSVINQTYDNVEYIIIDAGSTDGTLDIIKKYEHAIDYWVSEKDKGIYDAMNKGIDLATGEWINFMNSGDAFFAETVLHEVFEGEKFNGVDIVYGNHKVLYPSGRKRFVKAGKIQNLWKGSQFCHQATFVKAKFHKQYKFNLCTKIVADFEFFYKAWKAFAKFESVDVLVARFEAGGVSDVKRVGSILGRWTLLGEKESYKHFYYLYLVLVELLKKQLSTPGFRGGEI